MNNFNKFERIFAIFGAHYPDDAFYQKHLKLAFKIYLLLCSLNAIITLVDGKQK